MSDRSMPDPDQHRHSPDISNPSADKTISPPATEERDAPSFVEQKKQEKTMLPSHATLAYGNYPPLWSPLSERSSRPKAQHSGEQHYTSAESMRAILNTGSSPSKKPNARFEERDPSNHHQYLQGPDRRYTHPRLNIFGEDVTPVGSPPSFGWRKKK